MDVLFLFAPLLAALIAGAAHLGLVVPQGRKIAICTMALGALGGWWLAYVDQGEEQTALLWRVLESGSLICHVSVRLDALSLLIGPLLATLGVFVCLYSIQAEGPKDVPADPSGLIFRVAIAVFFANLFLVGVDLFQLLAGWLGASVALYLAAGVAWRRSVSNRAANALFVVQRVGDLSLVIAFGLLFSATGTLNLDMIVAQAPQMVGAGEADLVHRAGILTAAVLVTIAVLIKAGQFVALFWLEDLSETPVPMAALTLACCNFALSIAVLVRLGPVVELSGIAAAIITVSSAITPVMAASIAATQTDIKKIVSYLSAIPMTVLLAGFPMGGSATLDLISFAAVLALLCCLFLTVGIVIHVSGGQRDIRNMGGLLFQKHDPVFRILLFCAVFLAVLGIFLQLLGPRERAHLLTSLMAQMPIFYGFILAGLALGASVMGKLVALVFLGEPQDHRKTDAEAIKTPRVMVFATVASMFLWLFLSRSPVSASVPASGTMIGAGTGLTMIVIASAFLLNLAAWSMMRERTQAQWNAWLSAMPFLLQLLENGVEIRRRYEAAFVRPAERLGAQIVRSVEPGSNEGVLDRYGQKIFADLQRGVKAVQSRNISPFRRLLIGCAVTIALFTLLSGAL